MAQNLHMSTFFKKCVMVDANAEASGWFESVGFATKSVFEYGSHCGSYLISSLTKSTDDEKVISDFQYVR